MAPLIAGLAALASMALIAPAPSYDPWAWLLWGREVAGGELSTEEGPAFKPLPVAVTALLSPLGDAAPWVWVLLVRIAFAAALVLAFREGRRLGGTIAAGVVAAIAVALCGGLLRHSAAGADPVLAIAGALAAAAAWRAGHLRAALLLGAACALVRVEAWPFLAAAGVVAWRREPRTRALLAALAVAVPAAWLLPELAGSGDVLRSGDRARIPNPGQPALADVPFLASLEEAATLPLLPVWLGLAVLAVRRDRRALPPVAAGAAWLVVVAVMAEAGFSGEARYALPGVALLSIAGAAALASLGRGPAVAAAVVLVFAAAAAPRLAGLPDLRRDQAHQQRLASELADAVAAAGGRDAVLACGRPYVGRLRGPLMAYRLDVRKREVEPDEPPRAPGVVFRSRLRAGEPVEPAAPAGFRPVARTPEWEVVQACS